MDDVAAAIGSYAAVQLEQPAVVVVTGAFVREHGKAPAGVNAGDLEQLVVVESGHLVDRQIGKQGMTQGVPIGGDGMGDGVDEALPAQLPLDDARLVQRREPAQVGAGEHVTDRQLPQQTVPGGQASGYSGAGAGEQHDLAAANLRRELFGRGQQIGTELAEKRRPVLPMPAVGPSGGGHRGGADDQHNVDVSCEASQAVDELVQRFALDRRAAPRTGTDDGDRDERAPAQASDTCALEPASLLHEGRHGLVDVIPVNAVIRGGGLRQDGDRPRRAGRVDDAGVLVAAERMGTRPRYGVLEIAEPLPRGHAGASRRGEPARHDVGAGVSRQHPGIADDPADVRARDEDVPSHGQHSPAAERACATSSGLLTSGSPSSTLVDVAKRTKSRDAEGRLVTRRVARPTTASPAKTDRTANVLVVGRAGEGRTRLSRADGGTRERVVVDLQRTSGNRAVGQALSKSSRTPGTVHDVVVQREKIRKTKFDRAAVEVIKANAEARHDSITSFISQSRSTLHGYKSRLLSAATVYKVAFGRHKAVLDSAGEAAADRKAMISTIAGFVTGVALGPASAIANLSVRAAVALSIGSETLELAVGGIAGRIYGTPDRSEFAPTAEIPELKELAVWQTLAEVSDKLLGVALLTSRQMKISSAAGVAIAEIRLREGGAKNIEQTDAQLTALIAALKQADEASYEVALGLQGAKAELEALGANPTRYLGVDEVEQNIWIEWIADLRNDDLLDEDDITDHLEALGVIGEGRRVWDPDSGTWSRTPPRLAVDFGSWVSDDDEVEAVKLAKAALGRYAADRDELPAYDPDFE